MKSPIVNFVHFFGDQLSSSTANPSQLPAHFMSVDFAELRGKNPEWTNCLFFNGDKKVLFQSVEVKPEDLDGYLELFQDYDTTITKGLTYNGVHYHVHRFYDGIMYGRADPNTKRTDGFCLYRTERDGKTPLYVLITYDLPDVSARVIPLMAKQVDEFKAQLE